MFLILLLIIAVAAFNLVSSLVMVVNDKQAEIAILRTIGATPSMILKIFIVQGLMVGVVGTLLGLIGGIILASNATAIVNHLHRFSMFRSCRPVSILSITFLQKSCGSIWCRFAVGLLMSFIATIYPAWRASRTVIAELCIMSETIFPVSASANPTMTGRPLFLCLTALIFQCRPVIGLPLLGRRDRVRAPYCTFSGAR
ncbi:outer membrane-specific lipoprotein transporter subunit; membrane component of ABC superfamily [Legionella taurinensis]|nr:outer membrane-specific lipoprotein transporter subunit; membrane component of ABC superfamily [Legionella taurinensis]